MKLEEIEHHANVLVVALKPYCDRISIAGSIRRRRPECADIDLVVIPKLDDLGRRDTFNNALAYYIQPYKKGEKIQTGIYQGIQTDVFIATEQSFEVILL